MARTRSALEVCMTGPRLDLRIWAITEITSLLSNK